MVDVLGVWDANVRTVHNLVVRDLAKEETKEDKMKDDIGRSLRAVK